MLTLHLIRHAKTQQSAASGKDFDRELLDKGIAQANLLGHYIQSHHIGLGKLLCSSAARTRQTHSIVCRQMAEQCVTDFRDALYHADRPAILHELSRETSPVLTLIGHNDGISEFASYCTEERLSMQTSELITLTFPFDSWLHLSRGTGSISLRYHPEVFLP